MAYKSTVKQGRGGKYRWRVMRPDNPDLVWSDSVRPFVTRAEAVADLARFEKHMAGSSPGKGWADMFARLPFRKKK